MPNTTCRVAKANGSPSIRVREAEYTIKRDHHQKELGDEKHPVHISARVARRPPDIAETTARAA